MYFDLDLRGARNYKRKTQLIFCYGSVVESMGLIGSRVYIIGCLLSYILDINQSNIAFSLPSEKKNLKSCLQYNFHGI